MPCSGDKIATRTAAPELLERFVRLTQKARAGELTAEDGQALVNALLAATGQDPLRRETARAFFDAYLADKTTTRAAATAKRYRAMSDRFLAHLGPRADQPLRLVTAADVRAFRDGEIASGLNRATVNLGLVFVRSVLEQAKREGGGFPPTSPRPPTTSTPGTPSAALSPARKSPACSPSRPRTGKPRSGSRFI